MGEIRLAVLCDHALVGQDGKVSLLGIFRNISVSGLPAQHPRMFLVAILGLDVGAHTVVVRLLRPDGQQAMPNPPEISVHATAGQDVNVIVELNNMNFTTYGTHRFQLSVDGDALGDLPVSIMQMPTQAERRTN
ncbi:MAG TPA: hypothetical protein VEU77_08030 [Candidatus Acidoferrales bacterium]|nr:hypothetical protein [Candidatus Acidoferrales bacterium]